MKKILAWILIALLAVSLFACGGKNDDAAPAASGSSESASVSGGDNVRQNFDKVTAYIESVIDTAGTEVMTDDEDSEYLYRTWFYEDFNTEAEFPREVVVDGKTIVIGETKVKDLPGLGFEVDKFTDVCEPNEVISINIRKGGKQCVLTLEPNETDQTVSIDDLSVFKFTGMFSEFVIPFSYSGLSDKSTMQDVLDLFGKPNSEIHISVDSFDTIIDLSYLNETQENDWVIADTLTLSLTYSPENDATRLFNINVEHFEYQACTPDMDPGE